MAGSATWVTRVSVYALLGADAALQTLLGTTPANPRVFDAVPTNQPPPYVVIGRISEVPFDTIGRSGKRLTVPLLVESRYPGEKEVSEIAKRLAQLLDRQRLSIEGYDHVSTAHLRTTPGADGDSRFAQVDFELLMMEAA